MLGNMFAALMDEAEKRRAEDGEGCPKFLLADDVTVSQTETQTVGRQSNVEGPVEPSLSEQKPNQDTDLSRMSFSFKDALNQMRCRSIFLSVRAIVMKSLPKFVRGAYNAAMRIALPEIEAGSNPRTKKGRAKDGNYFLLPRMLLFRLH